MSIKVKIEFVEGNAHVEVSGESCCNDADNAVALLQKVLDELDIKERLKRCAESGVKVTAFKLPDVAKVGGGSTRILPCVAGIGGQDAIDGSGNDRGHP